MSDLIRTVRSAFTPMPGGSSDARVPAYPDTYRYMQNQIEAAERHNQRALNRTIRTQNINAAPLATERRPFTVPESINALITLVIP